MPWFHNNDKVLQASRDAMASKGVADTRETPDGQVLPQTQDLDTTERPVVDKIGQGFAGAGRMSGAWAEKWRNAANRAREDLAVNSQEAVDQRNPLHDALAQLEF